MTAKPLTPAMMRAMEPYLPDLIADWTARANGLPPGRACALCQAALPCPVFDCTAGRKSCFEYFPEAEACYCCKTHREGSVYAAVVLTQLEEIRDWLKAQREKGATADGADDPLVKAAKFVQRLRAQRAAEAETKGESDE